MFEATHEFEIPVTIGAAEVADFTGTALLEGETGPHDYGFKCVSIALDGNRIGDFCDKRIINISAKSDDPFCQLLFERLAARIETDQSAADEYYSALEEHLAEAA